MSENDENQIDPKKDKWVDETVQQQGKAIATRIRKRAMLDALRNHMGIVAHAIKEVGINRSTHHDWLKDDPDYAAAVEEIGETLLDFGEAALMDCIKDKEFQAIKYFLNCKGRRRGYVERTAIDVAQHTDNPEIPGSLVAESVTRAIEAEMLRLTAVPAEAVTEPAAPVAEPDNAPAVEPVPEPAQEDAPAT